MGAIEKLIQGESIQTGITLNGGRDCRLRIKREPDTSGFEIYIIENLVRKEMIKVPRYLFEFFKVGVQKSISQMNDQDFADVIVEFKGKVKIRFEKSKAIGLRVVACDDREVASGSLQLNSVILKHLLDLLNDERIGQGSDILKRILAYHRLFKFTFSEATDSLNSGLSLRTDVLSQVEDYVPPVGKRTARLNLNDFLKSDSASTQVVSKVGKNDLAQDKKSEHKVFKSRLAERDGGRAWKVDYQALFSQNIQRSFDRQPKANSGEENKKEGSPRHAWLIPLLSSEVKLGAKKWRCELSSEDIQLMRDSFLEARDSEYFLGFEIIDAIYKTSSGKLKTFRFPLYYLPIEIQESGRVLILNPSDESRLYLNHLALATLVESFSPESNSEKAVESFFETLLAQRIEVNGKLGRIYLSRSIPCSEDVFDRSRDVLLGQPGENGKGGILGNLEILGAECDTDAVFLYKSSKESAPLQRALELDLEEMGDVAERSTERFSKTIPGRFLGTNSGPRAVRNFCNSAYIPGHLPHSTRKLLDKLNHHDVVLLEGPPGTGKTHTIMNLLIHAIASGQKILIVSDQEAALHALMEKMEGYLSKDSQNDGMDSLNLWKKSVKIVDRLDGGQSDLSVFCRTIENCLDLSSSGNEYSFSGDFVSKAEHEIVKIDEQIARFRHLIQKLMTVRLGPSSDLRTRVAPKRGHATTTTDIGAFVSFLGFMGGGSPDSVSKKQRKESEASRKLIRNFVMGREFLAQNQDQSLYSWFQLPDQPSENDIKRIDRAETIINKLLKMNPKSVDALRDVIGGAEGGRLEKHFMNLWMNLFPPTENGMKHAVRVIGSLILHPAKGYLKALSRILIDQRNILRAFPAIKGGVWRQIQLMHESLAPGFTGAIPASLEVCRFATSKSFVFGQGANRLPAIQEYLEQIELLQKQRDSQVRKLFMSRLSNIASAAHLSKGGASNALTQLSGILQALKSQESLESGIGIWRELQSKIVDCFPIWLCRKQAVSFLFPCKEKIFDLVIVDEATQCRVDDALPLMYRARKVMVVGDDKQTVLAKNSVIDDYLFAEFNLDEHLRTTQARGIKGGGSHIFGLVKGIKEGGVMLDEHYRCPPAIIEYSNKYVYNSELKVMQWKKDSETNSVKIDWSEKDQPASARPDNGPYKAIEIDMVDRFFLFMEKKIKEIEKVTGARLNLEQDVAICYFLLKNEPYIKAKKSEFLAKMDRGSDVLDGAGAALQGKERPYIFYFWDISRSNMMAFRQGDDPDKRKGELNVLMSRPKKMAFHFLHKNFDELDHDKASITDFLWKAWNRQEEGEIKGVYAPRLKPPGPAFIPWKRSSGHLLVSILDYQSKVVSGLGSGIKARAQTSIVVGDSRYKVDVAVHRGKASVALVDICGFDWHENCAGDVVDYFFQLKRAEPRLEPVFVFIHELADARSKAFVRLVQKLSGEV